MVRIKEEKTYIVIVNWNGWKDTIECLESLFDSDYPHFRVLVCDNGSTDDSLEQIRKWASGRFTDSFSQDSTPLDLSSKRNAKPVPFEECSKEEAESGSNLESDPRLVLISITANLGFAGGNNVGIRYALSRDDFKYIWLLNNDTVVDPAALSSLIRRMKERPDAGMCGSALFYYDNPEKIQALGGGWHCKWIGLPWHYGRFNGRYDAENPEKAEAWMNYVEGASMLVSRDFVKDIGLMCEDYFLFFEETDWAIRAKGRYSLAYAPKSVVYHKVGRSIGTSSNPRKKSFICDFYSVRNRLLFTRRFYPYALSVLYPVLLLSLISKLILMQSDRMQILLKMFFSSEQELLVLRHD